MKANDIIQIGGIPYLIKRVYRVENPELTHKIRFTAYSYISGRKIDAAMPNNN